MTFFVTAGTVMGYVGTGLAINGALGDPLGITNQGSQDQANNAATNASNASAAAQQQQAAIAQDQWNYYKQNYQPLEQNLIGQASAAGSPEEFARNRGTANANVTGAYDTARKQTTAGLESYGINPGSGAFQSADASSRIAEAGSKAGAMTLADANTRNLAYSKALDVTGIGRNIPAQSAASSGAAASNATAAGNAANLRSGLLYNQNASNMNAIGNFGNRVGGLGNSVANAWYGVSSGGSNVPGLESQYGSGNVYTPRNSPGTQATDSQISDAAFNMGYAKGGKVGLESKKRYLTPHMKTFAGGGGVGRQGLEPKGATIDNETGQVIGPGTETSDSVPAAIDGQQPAALSSGEYVMNAEVPKLSGDEILTAINNAGLKKRQQPGLEPRAPNDAQPEARAPAYARGGRVSQFGLGA